MDNYHYFDYSKNNPEELFDSFYAKKKIVIPQDVSIDNNLTKNNKKMINDITAFKVLFEQGYDSTSQPIIDIVNDVVNILSTTKNINLSAFSQFFMVYNSTYSEFIALDADNKFDFVYQMLIKYCEERHDMYCSQGYTNTILQVMCDNYSHKRNSKTSIEKILSILSSYNLSRLTDLCNVEQKDNFYFLPDKGDSILFDNFLKYFNLKMESRLIEQNKYPDIVYKHDGNYYICELKTMKGSGGGQNKQIVEIAYFIKFSEENQYFHYVAFLDGSYSNLLFNNSMPKIACQRNDIIEALKNNPNNYFVNTAGMQKLVNDNL